MGEQILKARLTQAQRKVVAELLPGLAEKLLLDTPNQRTLPFTLDELIAIREKAQRAIQHAETGMTRNSLRHIMEATTKAVEDSQGIGSILSSERLYQFRVTLRDIEPPIWRRIQVRDCTLQLPTLGVSPLTGPLRENRSPHFQPTHHPMPLGLLEATTSPTRIDSI